MPNWCFNYLKVEGSKEDISAIKKQLNTPFSLEHDSWNMETKQQERKVSQYNNPVFAFWNIIRPLDMETYHKQPVRSELDINDPNWWADTERLSSADNSWYNWNNRNWGTKWDVAVRDGDEYPETHLTEETDTVLDYRFNTAWAPPIPAIEKLSQQYPEVEFELEYEEETGWGGCFLFVDGHGTEVEYYQNKCRDCGASDTLDYCDNGCGEICSSCKDMGEADLECVAECEAHRGYLPVN